jgi:DNA-binding NarL/FixJ family response regulator
MNIIIADDQKLFLEVMCSLFKTVPDIQVSGTAGDSATLFSLLAASPPDLVLLGINLPDKLGCAGIARRMRQEYPSVKIVALFNDYIQVIINTMRKEGVTCFVSKGVKSEEELYGAMRKEVSDKN